MFFTFRKRGCSFFSHSCFEFCKERNCKVTDIQGSYFSRSIPVLCFLAKSAIFLNIFVYGLCEMQFTLFMACAKCSSLKLFLRLVSPAHMFNPEYRRASFKYILSFEDIAPLNLVFLKAFKDSNDLFVVQRS